MAGLHSCYWPDVFMHLHWHYSFTIFSVFTPNRFTRALPTHIDLFMWYYCVLHCCFIAWALRYRCGLAALTESRLVSVCEVCRCMIRRTIGTPLLPDGHTCARRLHDEWKLSPRLILWPLSGCSLHFSVPSPHAIMRPNENEAASLPG